MATRKRKRKLLAPKNKEEPVIDFIPTPNDGLPRYKCWFDCQNSSKRGGEILRFWNEGSPIEEQEKILKGNGSNISKRSPLVTELIGFGYNREFSQHIARLFMFQFSGGHTSVTTIRTSARTLRDFLEFISGSVEDIQTMQFADLRTEHFIDYKDYLTDGSAPSIKRDIPSLKKVFLHKSVPFHAEINRIGLTNVLHGYKKARKLKEHTSDVASDNSYSDKVLFQLLSWFTYDYERLIDRLKEKDNITEDTLREMTNNNYLTPDTRPTWINGRNNEKTPDNHILVLKWLSDEKYYPIILAHEIVWYIKWGEDFSSRYLASRLANKEQNHGLEVQYYSWKNSHYGYYTGAREKPYRAIHHFLGDTRDVSTEHTQLQNRIGYCLVNIILIATGLNREVPLSWDSQVDGKSILEVDDYFFKKAINSEPSPDIAIRGFKNKVGRSAVPKEITSVIPKSSPIFKMMDDYEKFYKIDFDGPFFEFTPSFSGNWLIRQRITGEEQVKFLFSEIYPIYDDDNNLLDKIDTRRFRKVFASGKLFSLINNISNPQELADHLKEALDHDDLDTTLSHYITHVKDSRSAIDIAISTIMNEKLEEFGFVGSINHGKSTKTKKQTYLCDCEDPTNPTHGFSIADECRKYDLCLGCHRSEISQKHLPYICYRIIQYEEIRESNQTKWAAFWEDRWLIAHDALKQYRDSGDVSVSNLLVDKAWDVAKKSINPLLPSLTMTEIGK